MALNLEGSSIGFDENAASAAVELAKGHLVDGTRGILTANELLLRGRVDNVWVGNSAEVFKKNFSTDIDTIKKNLEKSFEIYSKEMVAISKAMGEIDGTAVAARN